MLIFQRFSAFCGFFHFFVFFVVLVSVYIYRDKLQLIRSIHLITQTVSHSVQIIYLFIDRIRQVDSADLLKVVTS